MFAMPVTVATPQHAGNKLRTVGNGLWCPKFNTCQGADTPRRPKAHLDGEEIIRPGAIPRVILSRRRSVIGGSAIALSSARVRRRCRHTQLDREAGCGDLAARALWAADRAR
jgi:hypothetical protein